MGGYLNPASNKNKHTGSLNDKVKNQQRTFLPFETKPSTSFSRLNQTFKSHNGASCHHPPFPHPLNHHKSRNSSSSIFDGKDDMNPRNSDCLSSTTLSAYPELLSLDDRESIADSRLLQEITLPFGTSSSPYDRDDTTN